MKKIVSLILALIMSITTFVPCFGSEFGNSNYLTIDEINEKHNEVRELINQISALKMKDSRNDNNSIMYSSSTKREIEEIEKELALLGVEKISISEIDNSISMRSVEIPESTNENWYKEEYNYSTGGSPYTLTIITGQAKNKNSVLWDEGMNVKLTAAPGIAAGTADYIRIAATAATGTIGSIFGTIYDVLSTTISNLTTSTIIQNVESTYRYQCDTVMHYVYVKPINSSLTPRLCYIYNEVNVYALGVVDNVKFNSTTHNSLGTTQYELEDYGLMRSGASNMSNAVNSYNNTATYQTRFVTTVKFSGVGNKTVKTIYVCTDTSPYLFT